MKKLLKFRNASYSTIIHIELKEEEQGKPVLSIHAGIEERTNNHRYKEVCYGQCYDELLELFPEDKKILRIVAVWKKYHLNDLHPECEHQRKLGWNDSALEEVNNDKYNLIPDICSRKADIKNSAMEALKNHGVSSISEEDRKIINLPVFTRTPEVYGKDFYRLYKAEKVLRGHLSFEEDSRGLLGKPCPVCGYKYGHAWQYMPIPAEIIEEVKNW